MNFLKETYNGRSFAPRLLQSNYLHGAGLPSLMAALFLVLSLWSASAVSAWVSEEYQIKAAFMVNFARFVTWPDDKNKEIPFVFEVLGENPFGQALEPVNRQQIKGRKAIVRYIPELADLSETVQVLFVSYTMVDQIEKIIKQVNGRPVLTISDIPGFAMAGGMIEFVERDNSIHFIVNLKAVRAAGLDMNYQLLQLADNVIGR